MSGKIRIVFVFLIVLSGGLYAMLQAKAVGKFPYTYRFESFVPEGAQEASQSDVLIVGDRMGRRLSYYTRFLDKQGWKVYNWSEKGEGLHRTINKLRHLQKIPPVVIYHGGGDEFYEKRFHSDKDYHTIRKNLIFYQKNKDSLWVRQFSRFVSFFRYSASNIVSLGSKPLFNPHRYEAFEKQRQMELTYHFFEMELQEFWGLLFRGKERRPTLIVVPPPLNLDREPGKVCANSITRFSNAQQKQLEFLLKGGAGEGVLDMAEKLVRASPGNARSLYLRGMAYKSLGKLREAKAAFYRAGAFDCDTSRGNIVLNKLMVTWAEKQNLTVVDFNNMVNNDFGEENIFIESLFPAKHYYQQLMGVLEEEIGKSLKK